MSGYDMKTRAHACTHRVFSCFTVYIAMKRELCFTFGFTSTCVFQTVQMQKQEKHVTHWAREKAQQSCAELAASERTLALDIFLFDCTGYIVRCFIAETQQKVSSYALCILFSSQKWLTLSKCIVVPRPEKQMCPPKGFFPSTRRKSPFSGLQNWQAGDEKQNNKRQLP